MSATERGWPSGDSAELSVRRGREAVAFYEAAFGATVIYRVGGTDTDESVVAQLTIGATTFWVSDESPPDRNFSPESLGGSTVRLLLVVEDTASTARSAAELGAVEVAPVAEEHGWLLGRIEDPVGHQWEIGKPLVDWPPSIRARVTTAERVSRAVRKGADRGASAGHVGSASSRPARAWRARGRADR